MISLTRRQFFPAALSAGASLRAQSGDAVEFLSFDAALPAIQALSSQLPDEFQGRPTAASWSAWETRRDHEIRKRLDQGDADSVGNFALLGTSFTAQPRLTGAQIAAFRGDADIISRTIMGRVANLAGAVARPGANERLQFVAEWLTKRGVNPSVPANREAVESALTESVLHELGELESYEKAITEAQRGNHGSSIESVASSLYRRRGLSLDTSFRPNCGIEQTLADLKSRGIVKKVERAGIIGPGLDFTDKRDGYDFYPVQTLQPFALIDSLRRLGLADSSGPSVQVFDLSMRVLGHIRRAVERARTGTGYTVQVPLDGDTPWLSNAIRYWQMFGSEIGIDRAPIRPPAGLNVKVHSVHIGPDVVKLLRPVDLDIITEHQRLPSDGRLGLIIATNIFVYYNEFEHALAMLDVDKMLRPGGVLLTNNDLPAFAGAPMRFAGSGAGRYSSEPGDGDNFFCYLKGTGKISGR